ncbi:MAG: hypothetical protein ILP14_09860 [Oscillospiraceae bacterium]|nr:hypothetical protein [Oscillospiraceae bacterium]
MNRKTNAVLMAVILFLAIVHTTAFADQPSETVSYQYNENGSIEVVTVETVFPDGLRKTTITILDPVFQLPVSEDTVIYSSDGSRETVNVTYTRDEFGNLLEKLSITVEPDGSELKDIITNNSYGSNTYRRTECFDKSGTLMMSEEISYIYSPENILRRSIESSYQQNGHDIKTVTAYDETGEKPIESTVDYSYADGSSGTVTMVYNSEDSYDISGEGAAVPEDNSLESGEVPSTDSVSLAVNSTSEETRSEASASVL